MYKFILCYLSLVPESIEMIQIEANDLCTLIGWLLCWTNGPLGVFSHFHWVSPYQCYSINTGTSEWQHLKEFSA